MTIRPWFLATLSLGFVAFLLLIRDDSPLPAGDQALEDAKNRVAVRGLKVLGQAQRRVKKSARASEMALEGISDKLGGGQKDLRQGIRPFHR
jgi:hypothetical protein